MLLYFSVALLIISGVLRFWIPKGKDPVIKPVIWLNGLWYIFIIVFLGQLGPIIGYLSAFWAGNSVANEVHLSAGRAELISCATAILAGGTFFLVKEYNSSQEIKERGTKSLLILLSAVIGLACIGITAQLLAANGLDTVEQKFMHWAAYICALLMAFALWVYEEWQGTAAEDIKEMAQDSREITEKSKQVTQVDGVKV